MSDEQILKTVVDIRCGITPEEKREYLMKMTEAMIEEDVPLRMRHTDVSHDISFIDSTKLFLLPLEFQTDESFNDHKQNEKSGLERS